MVEVALVVLVIIAVTIVVGGGTLLKQRMLTPHSHSHPEALWKIEQHPRATTKEGPTAYAVYVVHPDEEPQLIDAVYWKDPDFDIKLAEARVEATIRCDILNAGRKRLGK